jgi:hypothetical protein
MASFPFQHDPYHLIVNVHWPEVSGEGCFDIYPVANLGVYTIEQGAFRHIVYQAYFGPDSLPTSDPGPDPEAPRPFGWWVAVNNGSQFGSSPAFLTWNPPEFGWFPGVTTCTLQIPPAVAVI